MLRRQDVSHGSPDALPRDGKEDALTSLRPSHVYFSTRTQNKLLSLLLLLFLLLLLLTDILLHVDAEHAYTSVYTQVSAVLNEFQTPSDLPLLLLLVLVQPSSFACISQGRDAEESLGDFSSEKERKR